VKIEPFKLERWMTTYETNVRYDIAESGIFPMTAGELIDLLPESTRAEALNGLLATPLGYSEARGTQALREEIARTYRDLSPDDILVTTGAIEANFVLLNTLLEPGDHVVAVDPAYQQLQSVPRAIGCEVALWRLRPENGFRYDLDELERLVTPRTKLIVINTPHNPTGAVLTAAELRRIYDLAERLDARILSDEAYRWLELPGGEPIAPPLRDLGPRAISVGTFSKPFGLPGLRIGWIAATPEIVQACWGMRDYISLSPGKLNDALALVALRHRDRIAARTREIVAANLDEAEGWFARNGDLVSWSPPRAGLLALMKYELRTPSLGLANRLAEDYSVMLAPGSAFGYEGYLRIGVGQTPPIFAEGLRQTERCLRALVAEGIPAG